MAAASVLAKVTRDRIMVELDQVFPAYGFAEHKGYSTPEHSEALQRHGPCPQHRYSYANVASSCCRYWTFRSGWPWMHRTGLQDRRGGVRSAWRSAPAWKGRRVWTRPRREGRSGMSTEDLEKYETEMELQLYREYRDIVRQFSYVVETERRFYLANQVDLHVRNVDGEVYFEVEMHDAWVWDMYRPARFVKNVRVMTFKDVNVEELEKPDISLPTEGGFGS